MCGGSIHSSSDTPGDMLVAGWMKYEPPNRESKVVNIRDAAKHNRQAMGSLPVQLQPQIDDCQISIKCPRSFARQSTWLSLRA